MAFNDLNKEELLGVGQMFAVDLNMAMKKEDMINELNANGVEFEEYETLVKAAAEDEDEPELALLDDTPLEPEAPAVEEDEDMVVVKMTRTNPRYDICGYSFTRDHPFALVKEQDAEYLIEVDGGFSMATPREIREYYAE